MNTDILAQAIQTLAEAHANQTPEAPASISFKAQSPAGFELLLTVRNGAMSNMLKDFGKLEQFLIDNGFTPPAHRTHAPSAPAANNAPLCPTHGKPMKKSKRGGWYCPEKIADDDGTGKPVYCKQTAK